MAAIVAPALAPVAPAPVASAPVASESFDCAGSKRIDALLASIDEKDGLGLVRVIDQVMKELEDMGLVHSQRLPPRAVGVHPSNRDGIGVNAEDVHALGGLIMAMGWSWPQVASAVCVEEAPGSTAISEFNEQLAADCERLPPPSRESIRYGSLACSHTNMFLRCLCAGVASDHEDMADDGYLSMEKVARRDPELARAAKEGIEWKVISHRARPRFPQLLSLLQRARNAPQSAAQSEHEIQLMLRMHALAVKQQKGSSAPDWDAIRRSVAPQATKARESLHEYSVFVAVCAGGVDGAFLKDLAAFHRQFVDSRQCTINGAFFAALAECSMEAPYLKIALAKAQYMSPKRNRYGEPTMISPADLTKLSKKKSSDVQAAESLLSELRLCLRNGGLEKIPHNARVKIVGRMDTMVARFVVGKQDGAKVVSTSLQQIASIILKEFEALGGIIDEPTSLKYAASASTSSASGASTSQVSTTCTSVARLQEYKDGVLVDALAQIRAKGFDVGSDVARDSTQYKVVDATRDGICLKRVDADEVTEVAVGEFLEKYEMRNLREVEVVHPGWPMDYTASTSYRIHVAKTRIQGALIAAAAAHAGAFARVDVIAKPRRFVRANTDVPKYALVLVPDSLKVQAKAKGERLLDTDLRISYPVKGVDSCLDGLVFVVSPMFHQDLLCPAWACGVVSNEAQANMVWTTVRVSDVQVAEPPHECKRSVKVSTKVNPDELAFAQVSSTEYLIDIPVLTNKRALVAKDELRVYRVASARVSSVPPVKLARIMRPIAGK